jgi:hypothetical protein
LAGGREGKGDKAQRALKSRWLAGLAPDFATKGLIFGGLARVLRHELRERTDHGAAGVKFFDSTGLPPGYRDTLEGKRLHVSLALSRRNAFFDTCVASSQGGMRSQWERT